MSDGSHEPDIDAMVAYHQEMEFAAINGGNFAQAKHHRNMLEIYRKLKEHLAKNVQDI